MDVETLTLVVLLLLGIVALVTLLVNILALLLLLRVLPRMEELWRELPKDRYALYDIGESLKELTKVVEEQTNVLQYIERARWQK